MEERGRESPLLEEKASSVPCLVDVAAKRSRVGRAETPSGPYPVDFPPREPVWEAWSTEAPSVPFQLEFGSIWQAAKHVQGILAPEDAMICRNWRAKDRI